MTSKDEQIEWRRSSVLTLSSQGHSEREIVTKLQVSRGTVYQDLRFITKQAQENLQYHIHKIIPLDYQRAMTGMKSNLKKVTEIIDNVADPRLKLQAISIANDCHRDILELSTNAGIISDALEYVNKQKDRISVIEKIDQRIEAIAEGATEETTTNGIF